MRGRYTLERELGRGGMATVHLARDLKHDRPEFQSEPLLRELRAQVEALPKVPVPAAIEGLASRLGDA